MNPRAQAADHTLQHNPHLLLPRISSEPAATGQLQNPQMMQLCIRRRVCSTIIQAAGHRNSDTATHHSWGRSLHSTNTSCIFWRDYFLHTKINTVKGKPQEKVKLNITSGFANTFLCLLIKSYPVVTTMPGRWGCWVCLHFPDTKLRMKSHSESHTTFSWFSWELN